jgi:hypothetical protein
MRPYSQHGALSSSQHVENETVENPLVALGANLEPDAGFQEAIQETLEMQS